MASCGNQPNNDYKMGGNSDDGGSDDEFQANKSKRKDVAGGSGSKPSKRTRSSVWDHFTRFKDNVDKCGCNYCGKEMTCPTKSGTSNMKKHLLSCKTYQVWFDAHKNKNQTVISHGQGSDDGSIGLSRVSETIFREATNEMIVLAELPLAFVECVAWKHFCNKTRQYRPHSRRTATRDVVQMYVKRKAIMKKILGHNKQRLSLTTDIWVAQFTGASYMVVTAHFVDNDWKLKKMIIGFKNIYDHKGATICKVLLDCLDEWDIKKIFCITVDNATANSSAMRRFKEAMKKVGDNSLVLKGEYMHLRCATHILNLIVQEGLQEIDTSVCAIRNGITYVRSSTNRLKSFELRVETGRIKRGSLPLDVKTRWNSTYLMLEQALKYKLAFDKMEAEDKPYNDYFLENVEGKKRVGPPSKSDWDSIESLVQILIIFYKSTLVLSASTTVASHKIYNEIVTITKNLSALEASSGPSEELKSKAASMLKKLGKYWDPFGEKVELNKLLIVASVFDPRNKMKFAQLCFDTLYGKASVKSIHMFDYVSTILKNLFEEYSASVINSASGGSAASSQTQGSNSQSQDQVVGDLCEKIVLGHGLGYERMDNIYNEIMKETGIQEASNELELYLKENVENPKLLQGSEYDLLSWWKVNSGKFPVLSLIAKDILAMQVTSVASESAFSTSGRVLDPYRSCLTPYMVEVLMCTEQWLKCEIKINEKGVVTIQQMLAEIELQDDLMREFEPEFNLQGAI